MKRIKLSMISGAVLFAITSCSEDSLIFPENASDNGSREAIDVLTKPSDVILVGDYDYRFKVVWPELSDKVSKIVVAYADAGENKTKEFTDFSEDGIIETSEYGEYTFLLTSYDKANKSSKEYILKAVNKGFIIEEVLENAIVSLLEGELEIRLLNNNHVPITTTINYPGSTGQLSKTATSSDEVINIDFPMQDGDHAYTVELKDEQGHRVSKEFSYTFDYMVNTEVSVKFQEASLKVSNNAKTEIAKIKVTYPTEIGDQIKEVTDISSGDIVKFPAITGNDRTVTLEYEDIMGRSLTKTISYSYNPVVESFVTAAAKEGWSSSVSSNHEGDGGGAAALIDGNVETFWHTPWSGNILPWPHQATLDFGKSLKLTKLIINIRHNNGSAAPKDFDLQVSTDGVHFTTHQSFTNTSSTARTVVTYDINVPVVSQHVRLSFKNGFNAQWMNLGEISFEGYRD